MSTSLIKRTICALAIGATFATVSAPATASAGFWDWFNNEEPPPNYNPYDPYRPGYPNYPYPQATPQPVDKTKIAYNEFRNQNFRDLPFYIVRSEWTEADEAQFGKFITQMGRAIAAKKCNSVKTCMQSTAANMYANQDPPGLILYSDCADFPYFLRAYFAYHNGLPFGYVTSVSMNRAPVASVNDLDAALATKREDNSPYGNSINARGGANVARAQGKEVNFVSYVGRMFDIVSTRTFRVSPLTHNYGLSDVYPIKLNRQAISPGALVHSTGHLLVIWDVTPQGVIKAIDAHPDGTVQYKNVQPSTLDRSRPDQALGFYRFRPMRLEGAKLAANGVYYGGKVVAASDAELFRTGLWSLEQWYGPGTSIAPGTKVLDPNAWKEGFKKVSFFDYVSAQLRDANAVIPADQSVADMIQTICDQLQQRVNTVDQAMKTTPVTPRVPHPSSLPTDIFGEEDPTWGPLSSPGSDSRIRGSVSDTLKHAVTQFRLAKAGDKNIRFEGSAQDYVQSIRGKLAEISRSCSIQYKNSAGRTVKLSLNQALSRLDKMSFDPYHCPERRWGASGEELASCRDTDTNGTWYKAQQPMRNVMGKINSNQIVTVRSDRPITLSMLRDPSLIDQPDSATVNLGTATPPVLNLDVNFASPKFIELLTR